MNMNEDLKKLNEALKKSFDDYDSLISKKNGSF